LDRLAAEIAVPNKMGGCLDILRHESRAAGNRLDPCRIKKVATGVFLVEDAMSKDLGSHITLADAPGPEPGRDQKIGVIRRCLADERYPIHRPEIFVDPEMGRL